MKNSSPAATPTLHAPLQRDTSTSHKRYWITLKITISIVRCASPPLAGLRGWLFLLLSIRQDIPIPHKKAAEINPAAFPYLFKRYYLFSMSTYSRTVSPVNICLGLPIGSLFSRISFHCAIHPGKRPNANRTVNMSVGNPNAR